LPSKKDVMEEADKECKLCPEAVRRTVTTMLDMSLLRSPTFLLLAVSGFITMMGFYVPFMYMKGERLIHGKGKGTEIPLQAWTGLEASRRLRLPDFKTIGT